MKTFTHRIPEARVRTVQSRISCILLLASLSSASFSQTQTFTAAALTGNLAYFTPTITTQPASKTACQGGGAVFSVVASGTGLTYQWQLSTNGGGSWSNISNNSQYSSATTDSLIVTAITPAMNNNQYRVVVSDGTPVNSAAAVLTVNSNPLPSVWPVNQSTDICAAGSNFMNADPPSGVTYQWQISGNGGATWTNTVDGTTYSGSSAQLLTITAPGLALNGFLYHYICTSTVNGCVAISPNDTLHVYAPVISSSPGTPFVVCPGATSLSVSVTGDAPLTYQWQLGSTNLSEAAPYSGTTTTTLNINATTALNGKAYKLVITDAHSCSVTTPTTTLSVPSVSVSTSPASQNTCAGTNVTFSTTFSSTGGTPTRQWQTDNGTTAAGGPVTWTNVGTNSSSFSLLPAIITQDGFHYRVVLTSVSSCNTSTSAEAILHVGASGTWLGAVDTNWHVSGNWCGGVPVSTTDVLVPNWAPRMPTISPTTGTAFWQTIKIENTASLRITGGSYPYTLSPSAYNLLGTVAYIGDIDQNVLPATHGSLTIGGSLSKLLSANTAVTGTFTLGGSAKLVTGTKILTMKAGSNPISGAVFGAAASSWIVTGTGASGAANTGLGGLTIEQVGATAKLFPVGPTSTSYDPAIITNSGTIDNLTLAVNDQPLPGSIINSGVSRSWLLGEAVAGGSNVALQLQWNQVEEQSAYVRTSSQITRSNGSAIVQYTSVLPVPGSNPYTTSGGAFTTLTQFSVASYTMLLPVRLTGFGARRAGAFNQVDWLVEGQEQPRQYSLERSADGVLFNEIALIIPGHGQATYAYTDKDPGNAVTYYRLKMPMADGKNLLYSQTVTVTNQQGTVKAELRPSLINGNETNLFIILPFRSTLQCTLTDAAGRVQLRQTVTAEKGTQTIPLHIGALARGVYYLHVSGSDGMIKLLPLVKQ